MAPSKLSALGIKIAVPIICIAVLTIGLTAFLNQGKFDRTITELESARIRFVVNDIKANLETGLGLGLPLKGLANTQGVIDLEARKDASILSIIIYDETGSVVFHAGRDLGAAIPKTWQPAALEPSGRNWQFAEGDALVIGAGLSSAIGTPAGGIALRYSRSAHNEVTHAVAWSLKLASAAVIAITSLIAFFGIHILITRTQRQLKRMEDLLDSASSKPAGQTGKQADSEAMALVADVIESSRTALRELSADRLPQDARATVRTENIR